MINDYQTFIGYYNTFFEKVYKYIFFRSGRNKALAEDMTSEIFLKALEKFDSFDRNRPFSVWIYAIAHNHLTDYYKKFKVTLVPVEDYENEIKSKENLIKDLDEKLGLEKIQVALETLPNQQKQVITLKYINELSNQEIAEILETNEANVRVIQHRALDALKTRLNYYFA